MKDFYTLGLALIHIAINHYGITRTFLGVAAFILLAIIVWQLPNLIIAWKS